MSRYELRELGKEHSVDILNNPGQMGLSRMYPRSQKRLLGLLKNCSPSRNSPFELSLKIIAPARNLSGCKISMKIIAPEDH